ncbi:MAG: Ig-like domain-containing protein [Candidatus Yonathbacteria bacterium]|nr:Ig-like domain-containing protein [Candidatus Yonathbacteria bacterium]
MFVHAQSAASGGRGFFIAGIIFGIIALILFGVVIWAIVQYRRYTPDDQRSTRARLILLVSGGAALIFLILALVFLIIGRRKSFESTSGPSGGSTIPEPPRPPQLPIRVIERHTPRRDEQNVARNTSLLITFREAVDPVSVLDTKGTADVSDDHIRGEAITLRPKSGGAALVLRGKLSNGNRTVHAIPLSPLGDPATPVTYIAQITASVQKKIGGSIFPENGVYTWEFTTGKSLDITPPTIVSMIPSAKGTSAPNSAVHVVFSEPIDPATLDVTSQGSSGLALVHDKKTVAGSWLLGVDGKTAEFIPTEECGKSTCGAPIHCLPRGAQLSFLATPATLGLTPPQARFPYDGIVDLAGNSLDGDGDGKAEGAGDVYRSLFTTMSAIDTVAPTIIDVRPTSGSTNVPGATPVEILFSKPMLTTSMTRDSVFLEGVEGELHYRFDDRDGRTRVTIEHPPFVSDQLVAPIVSGSVQDLSQNCYQPCTGP